MNKQPISFKVPAKRFSEPAQKQERDRLAKALQDIYNKKPKNG